MRSILIISLILLVGSIGRADTITFDSQSIDHLNTAGPQTEGMFTYTATSGAGWEVQNIFGNPPSALATFFNVEGSAAGDTVDFTRSGGGFFTFVSVDTAALADNSDVVTITGFAGAIPIGTLILASSSTSFQTVNSTFSNQIDLLRVQVTIPSNFSARILDNFVLTPPGASASVPESLSFCWIPVLWAGLLLARMLSSRRRATA